MPRRGVIRKPENDSGLKDLEFEWLLNLVQEIKQRKYLNKHRRKLWKMHRCRWVCELCGLKLDDEHKERRMGYVLCPGCLAKLKSK